MDQDQVSDLVTQFVSITGSSTDQARFFVDSAGGNLETALSTYFETAGTTILVLPLLPIRPQYRSLRQDLLLYRVKRRTKCLLNGKDHQLAQRSQLGGNPSVGSITSFGDLSGSSAPSSSSRVRGISTMKDINSAAGMSGGGDMSEDDDDDEEGPTDLYAGGGRSGLNVQDPNQQSSGKAGGIVADILKKAKELAKMAGSAPPSSTANATTSRSARFSRLKLWGSDQVPSRPVVPEPASRPARQKVFRTALPVPGNFGSDLEDDDDEDENHEEEEELDDPNNKEILDAINHGRAPLDLLGVRLNQRVTMRVQKRLTENYIPPPKPPSKPFGGTGNRLGSPLPASMVRSPVEPAPQTVNNPSTQTTIQPSMLFEVDNTLPTTGVQIRLSDGSRVVTRFNHTHTIGDIRRHIEFSNPALATRPYALQTTFPSRDLTDDNQTIKEAGLLSAVVVQRYL
ncbi:hypothetical protein H4Q26_008680 [Puccinia striiformis f. sp. tritici PST-130]|nr:hypothetical protein H4Q26_008680 [Puccinia striiformis f. sp. tritici PST-130]